MKKLLLTLLLAIMSFASFSETHTFTSTYWGCYKLSDNNISYDKHTYTDTIIIVIGKDYIIIKSDDGEVVKLFSIEKIEIGETNFKGIYYYCSNGMLINVYADGDQLIVRTYQDGQIFWFHV